MLLTVFYSVFHRFTLETLLRLEAVQQANNTAHKYLTEAATLTNTLSLAGSDKVLLDCNPPMSQCC